MPVGTAEVELASEEEKKSEKDLNSVDVATGGEEPLLIPSSSFPGDLFPETAILTRCTLGDREQIHTGSTASYRCYWNFIHGCCNGAPCMRNVEYLLQ